MDNEKMEDIMLPGFRFHPTDEELVGFYLKRKIQQRPLTIELIKQLDIYKYDPWDLPKLATSGEKEWYFYCPRDRKYRNSARPNRVTGAGFWKATGTDRPIYSSEGSKCIGLKKSLVFYKGRAAKGAKTDWMMHEFRLPSLNDSSSAPKRFLDKTIPPNDSWAICRIFKKTNSSAQRALSQSWVSPPPQNMTSSSSSTKPPMLDPFSSYNKSSVTSNSNNNNPLMASPYNTTTANNISNVMINGHDLSSSSTFMFSPLLDHQSSAPPRCDVSSVLLNMSSKVLGDYGGSYDDGLVSLGGLVQGNGGSSDEMGMNGGMVVRSVGDRGDEQQWIGFPMSGYDSWRSGWVWEASPCPSEMSTTKCYT